MALYRVVKKAFLKPENESNLRVVRVGEEILFDGAPGRGLQPLDEAAELASRRAGGGWHRGSIAATFAEHKRGQ